MLMLWVLGTDDSSGISTSRRSESMKNSFNPFNSVSTILFSVSKSCSINFNLMLILEVCSVLSITNSMNIFLPGL
jgi:hypothetical protein